MAIGQKKKGSAMSGPIRSKRRVNGQQEFGRQAAITVAALATNTAETYDISDADAEVGDIDKPWWLGINGGWRPGNWTFFGSDHGGKTAAVLLSFIAMCKRNAVEPFAWFRDVLSRIAAHPIHHIEELLPHHWKPLAAATQA